MRHVIWALALSLGSAAHAQQNDPGARLTRLEQGATELETSLSQSNPVNENKATVAERRLIKAQVLYGVGSYDDAAILLYDVVERSKGTRSYPDALFYLADSLFKKGDNLLAREYFHKLIDELGERSPHYSKALERLVELVIRTKDATRIQDYLTRLDRLTGPKSDSVPYVRGKYAYSAGKYDEALAFFGTVPAGSTYALQAKYFIGVSHAAKGDLAAAAKAFLGVTRETPKGKDEETIVELSRLALGRVYYERDQVDEAVEAYQAISRRSPAFGDALKEIAWVYVKGKQYDRALRALELLQLADPKAAVSPEIRILEGNLRLRKAQAIGNQGVGNTAEEYAKADKAFDQTGTTYEQSKNEIDKALKQHGDRKAFFAALTGRAGDALDVQVEVPKTAIEAVREEPEAKRVIGVTKTLDEVKTDLDDVTKVIARVERAVGSPSRVRIFPDLASRRARAIEIQEGLVRLRTSLANDERGLVFATLSAGEQSELTRLTGQRDQLQKRLTAMPNSGDAYEERMRKAREAVDNVDKRAKEVEVTIYSLEAQLTAVERYYASAPGTKMTAADFEREAKGLRAEVAALRKQLDDFHREIELVGDEAGIGDELAIEEREVRLKLADAIRAEHAVLARAASRPAGDGAGRVRTIEDLLARADNVDKTVARVNSRIDELVEVQLREVKITIAEEKANLVTYQGQVGTYNGETAVVGSDVAFDSFGRVSKKFKDIVVRSDVGLIDVSWAQKEQAQKYSDRLRIDYAREKNTLDAEFRDVLGPEKKPDELQPPIKEEKKP